MAESDLKQLRTSEEQPLLKLRSESVESKESSLGPEPSTSSTSAATSTAGSPVVEVAPEPPEVAPAASSNDRDDLRNGSETPARQTAEVALVAAHMARNAAIACRKVLRVTEEAMAEGRQQVEAAIHQAEDQAVLDDARYFRNLGSKYASAVGITSVKAANLQASCEAAEAAATKAEDAAHALVAAEDQGMSQEEMDDRTRVAIWSVTSANAAAITAFRMECLALRAAKRCWQLIEDAEDRGSAINRRRLAEAYGKPCSPQQERRFLDIAAIFFFVFGCLILAAMEIGVFSGESHKALLSVGVLLIIPSVGYGLYRIVRREAKRAQAAEISRAREAIVAIEARLDELFAYFDDYSLSYSSGDDE